MVLKLPPTSPPESWLRRGCWSHRSALFATVRRPLRRLPPPSAVAGLRSWGLLRTCEAPAVISSSGNDVSLAPFCCCFRGIPEGRRELSWKQESVVYWGIDSASLTISQIFGLCSRATLSLQLAWAWSPSVQSISTASSAPGHMKGGWYGGGVGFLISHRLLHPWASPAKNTGVDCHSLLQGIFPTQGWNPGLLHWQAGSLLSEPPGKPSSCLKIKGDLPGERSRAGTSVTLSCTSGSPAVLRTCS